MSTAITLYDNIPDPLQFVQTTGKAIALSKMFGCESVDQGYVIALECATQRCTPFSLARRFDIIQGKLSMKADAMLGAFNNLGGEHTVHEYTSEACEISFKIDKHKPLRIRITWEDAQKEKWPYKGNGTTLKDNWATPIGRQDMLWARVVSRGVRRLKPEIVAGYYTPEEVADFIDVQASPVDPPEPIDVEAIMRHAAPPIIEVTSKPGQPITVEPTAAHIAESAEAAGTPASRTPATAATPQSVPFEDPQITSLKLLITQAKLTTAHAAKMIGEFAGFEGAKLKDLSVNDRKKMADFLNQYIAAEVFNRPASSHDPNGAYAGAGATAGADEGRVEQPHAPAPASNGHATKAQLLRLQTIITDLENKSPGYKARVDASLAKSGKSRLEELSIQAANGLIDWLLAQAATLEQARRDAAAAEAIPGN